MHLLQHCPVCKGSNLLPYAMKFQTGFPHLSRTRCISCGIVFANPVASLDELKTFYANYYDKGNFGLLNYKKKILSRINDIQTGDTTLLQKQKKDILTHKTGGNFLDIGFGLGEEMAIFHKLGFNVYGTEYDQDCINFITPHIPEAKLFLGDVIEARYPDNFFDVVNIFHVIEHLTDPVSYLTELRRILKPGGLLIIGTPDISSPAYKLFRLVNFLTFRVPLIVDGLEHTVIFTKKNLATLLAAHHFTHLMHFRESVGDSFSNIWSSDLSTKKKIVRYVQTFVKVNQILITQKK